MELQGRPTLRSCVCTPGQISTSGEMSGRRIVRESAFTYGYFVKTPYLIMRPKEYGCDLTLFSLGGVGKGAFRIIIISMSGRKNNMFFVVN